MPMQANLISHDLRYVDRQRNHANVPPAVLSERFDKMMQNSTDSEDMTRSLNFFNLDALRDKAEEFFGATCTGCYLIAQGGFNTVYILTFKDHDDVVARLSASRIENPANKNQELVVERKKSECAIHRFLAEKTTIPVPHIYYFTPYFDNPVGVPFMFMERVHGQTLADVWFSLSSEQQIKVFNSIIGYNAQLLQLEFSAVGFLYHGDGGFTVGPLGSSCSDGRVLPGFRGPFTTTTSYLLTHAEAHLHSIIHNIENWKAQRLEYAWNNCGADGISAEYATTWLQLFCKGIRGLSAEPISAVLYHDDLSLGNVMVSYEDPTNVVAVIDWDGSSIMPLWEDFPLQRFIADTMWEEDDKNLANQGRSMQKSLYSKANPKWAYSRLNLGDITILAHSGTMAGYSREFINSRMLLWYEDRCNQGDLEEIRSFNELKSFIDGSS
ncbi:kinase-like domain-containing protein [Crucibulum laeve]|uniref:Kinase-like domain-containing protein n=1 Tax=Crucibulum laeve TaxID=68775 RepID=A0A5C3LQW1_9AGAR|nr:kinase-like domain-containing protein [Crucibulum laeve]